MVSTKNANSMLTFFVDISILYDYTISFRPPNTILFDPTFLEDYTYVVVNGSKRTIVRTERSR